MGFLASFRRNSEPQQIVGDGLALRHPTMDDAEQWLQLRAESRTFLTPWEPQWAADELTSTAFRQRIRRYRELISEDLSYPYFIFANDILLGAITISNVRRGVAQSATLGYWIGEPHARKGHMAKALSMLLPHAFGELNLHRVEASCLPRNTPSIRLLESAHFTREGYAKAYLKIAGYWEDHLLFAKVRE